VPGKERKAAREKNRGNDHQYLHSHRRSLSTSQGIECEEHSKFRVTTVDKGIGGEERIKKGMGRRKLPERRTPKPYTQVLYNPTDFKKKKKGENRWLWGGKTKEGRTGSYRGGTSRRNQKKLEGTRRDRNRGVRKVFSSGAAYNTDGKEVKEKEGGGNRREDLASAGVPRLLWEKSQALRSTDNFSDNEREIGKTPRYAQKEDSQGKKKKDRMLSSSRGGRLGFEKRPMGREDRYSPNDA